MNKQGLNLGGDEELLSFVLDGTTLSSDKIILMQQTLAETKKKLRARNGQLKEKDNIIAKLAQRLRNGPSGSGESSVCSSLKY